MSDFVVKFLGPSRAEGSYDSTGSFSIKAGLAREKAARYRLENEGDWALKVLQALVCSKLKSGIRIQCLRNSTVFLFELVEPWAMDELKESVFGTHDSEQRALQHLERGLLPVAVGQKRPLEISMTDLAWSLHWDGKKLSQAAPGKSTSIKVEHLSAEESVELSWTERRKLKKERLASITSQIASDFLYSDHRVDLDGRQINYAEQIACHHLTQSVSPLFFWGREYQQKPWFQKLHNATPTVQLSANKLQSQESPSNPLRVLSLPIQIQDRLKTAQKDERVKAELHSSGVYWMNDGVLVGQDTLPFKRQIMGIQLYCPAEELPHRSQWLKTYPRKKTRSTITELTKFNLPRFGCPGIGVLGPDG